MEPKAVTLRQMGMSRRTKIRLVVSVLAFSSLTACAENPGSNAEGKELNESASPAGGNDATVLVIAENGWEARVSGELTRVGDCAGIGKQVGVWPPGTKVVSESPFTLRVPGLGEVQAGDELVGAGGYFDAAADDVGIEVPASCGTTRAVVFHVDGFRSSAPR